MEALDSPIMPYDRPPFRSGGEITMATFTAKLDRQELRYFELVKAFPLRPLRSDRELDRAVEVIDDLLDRPTLQAAERDYLEVLSGLVEQYEEKHHPIAPVSDADLLAHLIEA